MMVHYRICLSFRLYDSDNRSQDFYESEISVTKEVRVKKIDK